MVQIKVNKWNSLVQQVEENRQNILTLSETPPQFDAKGEWNSTTVYAQNDMINYNGSSYFSLQDSNANHTPGAAESAAWWQLLAAQGETGAQGAKGETGATGPEGDPGPGVYSAWIVDSTLQVHTPFVNAPAQGDLIIVDTDETTDANIGNMYIVTNPTGTSHIPLTNVQLTGNIRGAQGPKGDPGPQGPTGPAGSSKIYMHVISFTDQAGQQYATQKATIVLFTGESSQYSDADLYSKIGPSAGGGYVPVFGVIYTTSGSASYVPLYMEFDGEKETIYFKDSYGNPSYKFVHVTVYTDTVIQLS